MATVYRFEELKIWQDARRLAKMVFEITKNAPFNNDFRFRDQIRAASGSVMDNIAEGFERSSKLEFINFLSIAKGSSGETRSQLYRALDQKYTPTATALELIKEYDSLASKISTFISYLNQDSVRGQKFKNRV
ncbi:MAG TPA: four helix bundle protein [Chitinophaga sp.]